MVIDSFAGSVRYVKMVPAAVQNFKNARVFLEKEPACREAHRMIEPSDETACPLVVAVHDDHRAFGTHGVLLNCETFDIYSWHSWLIAQCFAAASSARAELRRPAGDECATARGGLNGREERDGRT